MLFFFQTVGFAGFARFSGPDVLSAGIVDWFGIGSLSGHPGGMPHWDLIQSSAAIFGRCMFYGPSFFSFYPRWKRGSHRSVAVLTPVGVGDGRQWYLVALAIEMLLELE